MKKSAKEAVAELARIKKANRLRVAKFRKKKRREGKRSVAVFLSSDARKKLHRIKSQTGETISEIVERAIQGIN